MKNYFSYPKDIYKLGIPSREDLIGISYRLNLIWHELGDDFFEIVYQLYEKKTQPQAGLVIDELLICEIDIFHCYFTRITHLLDDNDKEKLLEHKVDKILPIKNHIFPSNVLSIEKNNSGENRLSTYFNTDMGLSEFVRAKLALFELLFLFTNESIYLEQLLFFSKDYLSDKRVQELVIEDGIIERYKLSPWSSLGTTFLKDKLCYLNYPILYNQIADLKDKVKLQEVFGIEFKEDIEQEKAPRKIVYYILKEKGLANLSWEAFEKTIKKYDDIYSISRKKGRKNKEHREHPQPNDLINSQYGAFKLFNYCTDRSKYKLIRTTNFQACFEKYLDQIYLETPSGELAPPKLIKLLNSLSAE